MSLLGNIANKEIYDFLKTTTIYSSYFADQSKSKHIRPGSASRVPANQLPYYRHVVGEYILKEPVVAKVKNPTTNKYLTQTYKNTAVILNSRDEQTVEVANTRIYNDEEGVFDEMMYVTSLDTFDKDGNPEVIPFTLENLHEEYALEEGAAHTKTLAAYRLPSRYYELLCERYPKQVDLIKAIVYPVEKARDFTESELANYNTGGTPLPTLTRRRIEYIIDSCPNLSVLQYDDSILNNNERYSLVEQMIKFVDLVNTRWNIKEYAFEENYPAVLWTLIWSLLPVALVVQRYKNIKTPFAHSSHIWDYLISKGLESYKGYLNEDQTLFLYKNIRYILDHRGQQKITNLLIDELLSNVGLNIKCKTIVLDTTDTLNETWKEQASTISEQCASCGRRAICHKNIRSWACPNYLGIDNLCKAEPIVLTEEFAGASKQKIMDVLINQYGYSETEAKSKYKRSLLWHDSEVDAIREGFDRDQLTDLNGDTSTLRELIDSEYACGLEPSNSDLVVEEQHKQLQHIAGTVAPTKLLEITKNTVNARFMQQFNKFLTETLIHLAPMDKDGAQVNKTNISYEVSFGEDKLDYSLNYGEMMAMLYLGVLRENQIDMIYDHVNEDDVYDADHIYFRAVPNPPTTTENEYHTLVGGNRMVMINTAGKIGQKIKNADKVYRWAPTFNREDPLIPHEAGDLVPRVAGHEILTDFIHDRTSYNFPIPDQAKLTMAFKFSKPVKQVDLVNAWNLDEGLYNDYFKLCPTADKIVKIGSYLYAVKAPFHKSTDGGFLPGKTYYESNYIPYQYVPTKDTTWIFGKDYYLVDDDFQDQMVNWDWTLTRVKILGVIKNEAFFTNEGEIPVIPRFCRWYSDHLQPDEGTASLERNVTIIRDLAFETDKQLVPHEQGDTEVVQLKYDPTKSKTYQQVELERYIDVNGLIDKYIDLTEGVVDRNQIGVYLTVMFELYEQLICYVNASSSVKTNLAASCFLENVRCNKKYRINLVNMPRRTYWPIEGSHEYPFEKEATKVVTYDDWLKYDKTLYGYIKDIDQNDDWATLWKEFNSGLLDQLTAGCTSPYLETAKDDTTTDKLRELVTHLSSYKVNFITIDGEEKQGYAGPGIVDDIANKTITDTTRVYINPIVGSRCQPHIGGLFVTRTGEGYVYTQDKVAKGGKTYYKLVATNPTVIHPVEEIPLDLDVISFVPVELAVGTAIPELTYFDSINLFDELKIADKTLRIKIIRRKGKWQYCLGKPTEIDVEVPASSVDADYTDTDPFLPLEHITPLVKKKLKCTLYRKTVTKLVYDYGDPIADPDGVLDALLKKLFVTKVIPTYMETNDKVTGLLTEPNNSKQTVMIARDNDASLIFIYKNGKLIEEYVFETDEMGELHGPISGGYVNNYGSISTCDCGRLGPNAFKLDTTDKLFWDKDLDDPNIKMVGRTAKSGWWADSYWIDPITGRKVTGRLKGYVVNPVTGRILHEANGDIGDMCPHCQTLVKEGYSPS